MTLELPLRRVTRVQNACNTCAHQLLLLLEHIVVHWRSNLYVS